MTWKPNLRTIIAPPPLWREYRIGLEMRALLRDERFRKPPEAPVSRAVMLIPGFLTGDGSLAKYQDTVEFMSDDHRVLTARAQATGGSWQQLMMVHYRRKK